jgi:hypothetical protein
MIINTLTTNFCKNTTTTHFKKLSAFGQTAFYLFAKFGNYSKSVKFGRYGKFGKPRRFGSGSR